MKGPAQENHHLRRDLKNVKPKRPGKNPHKRPAKERKVPKEFPNDKPTKVKPHIPQHGDQQLAVMASGETITAYLKLQNVQLGETLCIGFEHDLPEENDGAKYRSCESCYTPYFIFTADRRLFADSDCWTDNELWCLDGWNGGSLWQCRSHFETQTWTPVHVSGGVFRFMNDFYGTYLDVAEGNWVDLKNGNPNRHRQWFTDPDATSGIPYCFFVSTFSAT